MAAFNNYSVWGCVLNEIGEAPIVLKTVERPFRVTSASIQQASPVLGIGETLSILATLRPHDPPLEVAFFDLSARQVTMGMTFNVGDTVVFHKRTNLVHRAPLIVVQLNGFYLGEGDTPSASCAWCSHATAATDLPCAPTTLHSEITCLKCIHVTVADIKNVLRTILNKTKAETQQSEEKKRKEEEECRAKLDNLTEENSKLKAKLAKLEEENKRQEDEIKLLLEDELKKVRFD